MARAAQKFQKRNLGIAYVNFGAEQRSPMFVVRGYKLLTEVQQQFSTDDGLFTAIGTALLLGKHPEEAEFAFDRALQLNPDSVSAETNAASAYLQAGNAGQAIAHLERAVAMDPLDLTAVAPLADLYKQRGNASRANELSLRIAAAINEQSRASDTSHASASPAPTTEKRYKNIKVLKGIPADQLILAMRSMTQSLGVQCSYCHVPNHFEDDTKKTKHIARTMMQMMSSINSRNFNGVREVTCYSCHRGHPKPESAPEVDGALAPESASIGSPDKHHAASLPTADEIIGKYTQALGGAAAIQAILTREEHGTITSHGTTAQVKILQKFPDRQALIRYSLGNEDFTIFNGRTGWAGSSWSVHDLPGSELDAREIAADLHLPIDMSRLFPALHTEYPKKIGDHDAYVLSGGRPGASATTLFFDQETGLLIRIVQAIDSPLGLIETETDYDDYRVVDQVKLPFRLTLADGNDTSTIQLEEVLQNVPVEDHIFEKPSLDSSRSRHE